MENFKVLVRWKDPHFGINKILTFFFTGKNEDHVRGITSKVLEKRRAIRGKGFRKKKRSEHRASYRIEEIIRISD